MSRRHCHAGELKRVLGRDASGVGWAFAFAILSRNPQGLLEFAGEFCHFCGDFGWLLSDRIYHSFPQFRLKTDQLHRRHHERELIIDFMAHVRKFLIQLVDLFRVQCHLRLRHIFWNHGSCGPDNQVRSNPRRDCKGRARHSVRAAAAGRGLPALPSR